MFRIGCTLAIILLSLTNSLAQLPTITSVDKKSGTANTILSISGSNFGSDKSLVKVSLGVVYAEVISATDNLITAKIPAGTTFNTIAVTNLQSGLSAYSNDYFLLSFGGDSFNPSLIPGNDVNPSNDGLSEHCLADFDNDGWVDIATANTGAVDISVFRNNSTVNSIAFIKTDVEVNATTLSIASEDLDGDGKKDLVAANSNDQVYVLENTSSLGAISFSAATLYFTNGNSIKKVVIKDIDKDGKADIIASSEAQNSISIFHNISTVGNIKFTFEPIAVPVQGAGGTYNIAVEDLNNDDLPEIVANSFLGQDIFVLPNTSSPGSISFAEAQTFKVTSGANNLALGDINEDGKTDVAISNFNEGKVIILINNSIDPTIGFETPVEFAVHLSAWGIDLGDLNGDGKVDIVVGSTNAEKKITILQNKSLDAELAFEPIYINASEKSKSIKIGDLNNNGKPDISYAGVDNSNIIINQNINCIAPNITSNLPLVVCKDAPLRLEVPKGINVNYEWSLDGNVLVGKIDNYLDVTASGSYKVKIMSVDGICSVISKDTAVVIIDANAEESPIEILAANTELCSGDSILMEVSGDFLEYAWSTGETTKSIYAKLAQEYSVDVKIPGGCSVTAVKSITALSPAQIIISADLTSIKKGQSVRLTASGGTEYVWTPLEGLSAPNISDPVATPTKTTTYKVKAIGENGCSGEAEITITVDEGEINITPDKIFTPNNDGFGDTWIIENIESYQDCMITIFNRAGEKVFEAKPYTNNWNGIFKGKPLPPGDYYFLIKSSVTNKYKTGGFQLIR